jgi:hypothetical protein
MHQLLYSFLLSGEPVQLYLTAPGRVPVQSRTGPVMNPPFANSEMGGWGGGGRDNNLNILSR